MGNEFDSNPLNSNLPLSNPFTAECDWYIQGMIESQNKYCNGKDKKKYSGARTYRQNRWCAATSYTKPRPEHSFVKKFKFWISICRTSTKHFLSRKETNWMNHLCAADVLLLHAPVASTEQRKANKEWILFIAPQSRHSDTFNRCICYGGPLRLYHSHSIQTVRHLSSCDLCVCVCVLRNRAWIISKLNFNAKQLVSLITPSSRHTHTPAAHHSLQCTKLIWCIISGYQM